MMKLAKTFVAKMLFVALVVAFLLTLATPSYGKDIKNVSVAVTGIEGELLNNVRAYLQIANLNAEQSYPDYQIRYLHRQARQEIRQALQPFGYYSVDVETELLTEQPEQWQANYSVQLNEPVLITHNSWQIVGAGSSDQALQQRNSSSPLANGQRFIHASYEAAKSRLLSYAIQRGYHQAAFSQAEVVVDPASHSATVDVVLDTGPRFRFGPISVKQSHISHDLLKRYARFEQGEPFSTAELSKLQVDLGNSDYFSQVQVYSNWQQADANHYVPITITSEPNRQTQYRYGLGYGTDTGARISAGINRRWVNDEGDQFRSAVQLAQYESTASAVYHRPGAKPQMDYQQLRLDIGDKKNDSFDARSYEITALDVFTFDRWQRQFTLGWLREEYRFSEERNTVNYVVPGMEWRYLQADERINVNNGWRLTLGIKGAAESLLSDADVLQGYAEFKSVWSLAARWRLLNRFELGASYTDNFDQLPPSLRFFAGGDNSVRGYAYEQLGPRNEQGDVIGGRYLAVASAEIDYQFAEQWRVALFTDIGNSMIEPNQDLKQSVGIGFRWISPVGAIRLDFAQAIDEPGNPWRIHFTLGPDL